MILNPNLPEMGIVTVCSWEASFHHIHTEGVPEEATEPLLYGQRHVQRLLKTVADNG